MAGEEDHIEHVHIVFLGGRDEHVSIGLESLDATALHVVTSTEHQKKAETNISKWCKKFKIREGTVQAVDDIFEPTAVKSLVAAVLRIVEHEAKLETENINWLVGITGGTQLMGAVGAYAANLVGGTPYYVSRKMEGRDFLPGGTTIMFPELGALNSLHEFKQKALRDILERESGTLAEVVEVGDDLFKLVSQLRTTGLIVVDEGEKKWSLTEIGKATIAVALEGPTGPSSSAAGDSEDEDDEENEDEDPIDEIGELVTIFKEVSDHNCHCPITAQALRIHSITVRVELWTWEGQDYLLLRTYDSMTGKPKKLDSDHPLSTFEEKRIVADMESLVGEFLSFNLSYIVDILGISKKGIANMISADDPTM